jgi:tRNA A58 N-methylase Trm61
MGPAGHGEPDFDLELTGGWDGLRTVVDVGGGTGAMLAALLRRHPHLHGTLVDLPGTVARADPALTAPELATRVHPPPLELLRPAASDRLPPFLRRTAVVHPPDI